MNTIGIICEYNPFHNGHLYHINKVKEMFPNSPIICILSGNFLQRGEISVLNKWEKARLSIKYGVDLVIELPFEFASQSADIFAKGSINILKELKVTRLVFGSECNNITLLTKLANIQINDNQYHTIIKELLDKGFNYPTAMSEALKKITGSSINTPNDILALSYIREILLQNANIVPISIKRTNDYHSLSTQTSIISASAIRNLIVQEKEYLNYLPCQENIIIPNTNKLFDLLKYQIITNKDLNKIQTVDEGIENKLIKAINNCNNIDEFINTIKTKRYTYNRINRMIIHIITNFTKNEASSIKLNYLRVLGFNKVGQKYLNNIKKELSVPLLVKYNPMLNSELKRCIIYDLICNTNTYELEFKSKPVN